jgi:hypothetical protein
MARTELDRSVQASLVDRLTDLAPSAIFVRRCNATSSGC